VVCHEALELFAGILAVLIGMMQEGLFFSTTPGRHDSPIFGELGRHVGIHRPADNTA
jgi:hypothetical protein